MSKRCKVCTREIPWSLQRFSFMDVCSERCAQQLPVEPATKKKHTSHKVTLAELRTEAVRVFGPHATVREITGYLYVEPLGALGLGWRLIFDACKPSQRMRLRRVALAHLKACADCSNFLVVPKGQDDGEQLQHEAARARDVRELPLQDDRGHDG